MNQDLIPKLEALHLNQNEAKVYLALLEIGQTSAGNIIKKVVLHRSVVYEALDKLINKKLVFKLQKNNISYFQATNPERLLQNVENEQQIAKDLMPQLKNMIDTTLPEITIHEGIEAYKRFWHEAYSNLPVGSTDYVAGSISSKWQGYLGKSDLKKITKAQIKNKIKWKMIVYDPSDMGLELLPNNPELAEYRIIESKFNKEGNYNIFNDDILILHSIVEPMVIEIKNASLVKVFKHNFDILWKLGKKI